MDMQMTKDHVEQILEDGYIDASELNSIIMKSGSQCELLINF